MSFHGQARLAQDSEFRDRAAACAATQGIQQANKWSADNAWRLSAFPGFAEAYTAALAAGESSPGSAETVIPDTDLRTAVLFLLSPNGSSNG